MLTACGIETTTLSATPFLIANVATVLTACGIETREAFKRLAMALKDVATVLTACGIETQNNLIVNVL